MSREELEVLASPNGPRDKVSRGAASLEDRIAAAPGWAFAWLSVIYFVVVFSLSSMKLLWLDELITLHIAKLPSAAAIWHALVLGADPNPPVTHLLVHYSRLVFGAHEFAYRLPAMVGYWVGLLALYQYLRGRTGTVWALGGTVLSMCMAAFEYSYESRSYGIFYGLAILAFFCWTRCADPARSTSTKWVALAGMVLALAAGISTNYFAVLAFFPIAAGETVRTILRARHERAFQPQHESRSILHAIDLPIWFGMAVAATPLIAYRPLIALSIAQFAPYAWNKVSLGQAADSYTEMVEVVLYPILALFALAVIVWLTSRRSTSTPAWMGAMQAPSRRWLIPPHEAAGVLFFMLYPFLGYAIASIKGGMLSPRFVIPVCYGFAIAATVLALQLFGSVRRAGIVFLGFVLAWFLCREAVIGYWYEEQKQCFYKLVDDLPEALQHLPENSAIVIPDPLLALTFRHYAPHALAARVAFPVDFPAIRHYRGDDSPEENLWAGRGYLYKIPVETVATFQHQEAGSFLIIASRGNWLLNDLNAHHYRVQHLPIDPRAESIGGFTPLARGNPQFYVASWEPVIQKIDLPVPFNPTQEVPAAKGAAIP